VARYLENRRHHIKPSAYNYYFHDKKKCIIKGYIVKKMKRRLQMMRLNLKCFVISIIFFSLFVMPKGNLKAEKANLNKVIDEGLAINLNEFLLAKKITDKQIKIANQFSSKVLVSGDIFVPGIATEKYNDSTFVRLSVTIIGLKGKNIIINKDSGILIDKTGQEISKCFVRIRGNISGVKRTIHAGTLATSLMVKENGETSSQANEWKIIRILLPKGKYECTFGSGDEYVFDFIWPISKGFQAKTAKILETYSINLMVQ
jgi:hypothetical protein